jgi:small subunit ribosomal protein S1
MSKMRDETLPLKVIEVNRRRRRLVMSQRDAQKEWQEARKLELINSLNRGDILMGHVSGLRSFGAFVDLGGADGLIHISELAWYRVNHPREVVNVGEEIEVYVLGLDKEEQRIALSRKRLLPNPWSLAEEKYMIDQLVEGTITRIVNYGAFVEVEPGIEGLLHISQLSRDTVKEPSEIIGEGETHLLRIISLDADRQRIGLSLRSVTASEQIEWMSQRKVEMASAEEEAAEDVLEAGTEEITSEVEAPMETTEAIESSSQIEMEAAIREAEELSELVDQGVSIDTSEEE